MKRAILIIALAATPLFADRIELRGGGRLTGEILEQSEESVTIDIGAGAMIVRMATVVSIEKGTSSLQEYRERAATLATDDVNGWRELGRWSANQGLGVQSREAYSQVHTLLPDDPEANRALGLILYEGRWVTEEDSYRARGFVEFEGEWMMPAERQAILDERRAREESDRQALAAEIQQNQAAIRERETKETEEKTENVRFLNDTLPKLGDAPVYWPYGYGPTAWPAEPYQQPTTSTKEPQ